MGCFLSKKTSICSSLSALPDPPDQTKTNPPVAEKKKAVEEAVKKEIFVIKHRKSHDIDRRSGEEKAKLDPKAACAETTTSSTTGTTTSEAADVGNNAATSTSNVMNGGLPNGGIVVRTSSCTKEEVDAILIQCGRLSRSSSTGKATLSGSGGSCDTGSAYRGRKYSGSKRSYDFDQETSNSDKDKKKGNGIENGNSDDAVIDGGGDDETVAERIHRHRQRQRQSRPSSSSGRRRTPSRERDQQQQRSGSSRERGSSGGGRRVSRSPGRRSESPITGAGATPSSANAGGSNTCNRPGKMVSVPATVSSLAVDKNNNGGGAEPPSAAAVKRISVKRNAGDPAMGCRSAASPRSRSPARANARAAINENQNAHSNQHQQQPLSLSRSNSRKAEHSPYRRNPLGEIDQNCIGFEVPQPSNKAANNILSQAPMQKQNIENAKSSKKVGTLSCIAKEQEQQQMEDQGKGLQPKTSNVAVTVVSTGAESLKPQTVTRSRSSRLSHDLDLNPETLLNPSPSSYTALLLEDIQSFHQKSAPAISLPPCLTKACSILEAVADLNSSTSSNLSAAVSDDRRKFPTPEQFSKNEDNFSLGANPGGKKRLETPFVESEVLVSNDLTEPSFHKYVTVRRGTVEVGDVEEQESSGSNSFVGGQQHWVSSSSWEPNSADSTDRWTSSRLNTREDDRSPPGFQRHAFSESGPHMNEAPKRLDEKERECDHQQIGIGRGRVGSGRGPHSTPTFAAAST